MHKLYQLAVVLLLIGCGQHVAPERVDAGWHPAILPTHPPVAPLPTIDPPRPPHKPVSPHPLVTRCLEQEKGDWEHLKGCLTAVSTNMSEPVDAGRSLKGPSPFPPTNNPSWLLPEWDVDPASRVATCREDNTGADSAHPVCTHQQVESRLGTRAPVWRQNTTEFIHSNMAVNPATDQIVWTPRVQNGAVATLQCDFVQVCSGTFSGVVQLSRAYPDVAISATLCAGLTQPTKIINTSHPCDMWIDTNTSGNTWSLSHFQAADGTDSACTISNGDSYTASVPVTANIRYYDPQWEDIADSPDSRPQLTGCNLGVGINTGAGTDTAQVYVAVNGAQLTEVAFNSSTMIVQNRFTHGSRAYGYLQNVFFSDNAVRTTIAALGPQLPNTGATGVPTKLIDINGGRLFGPFLHNVNLRGDVRVVSGATAGSGTITYGNVYMPTLAANQAFVEPNPSGAGILYGSGGNYALSGFSTLVCVSPAATNCALAGLMLDGVFDGYAWDDSVTPAQMRVHVPLLGNTLFNAIDTSIAGGGCAGRCVGRAGSIATVLNAVPASPVQWLNATSPITITQNSPGTGQISIGSSLATPVTVPNGGTGDTTLTAHATLLGEGTSAVSSVGPCTTNQVPLGVTGADPVCGAVTLSVAAGTGLTCSGAPSYTCSLSTPVTVPNGGTGDTTLTAHGVLIGEGTSAVAVTSAGTSGLALIANAGAGGDPAYAALNLSSAGTVSGTLGVSNGGTSQSSLTAHDVMVGAGTGAVTMVSPSTAGFVLTSNNTANDPSFQLPATPTSITSSVNHGSSTALSQGTYASLASVTMTIVGTVVDCKSDVEWDPLGQTGTATFQYGISQDSTTTPSTTRNLAQNASFSLGGALVESYTGVSAGSHTYRLLAETTTTCPGCTSNTARGDILCLQH